MGITFAREDEDGGGGDNSSNENNKGKKEEEEEIGPPGCIESVFRPCIGIKRPTVSIAHPVPVSIIHSEPIKNQVELIHSKTAKLNGVVELCEKMIADSEDKITKILKKAAEMKKNNNIKGAMLQMKKLKALRYKIAIGNGSIDNMNQQISKMQDTIITKIQVGAMKEALETLKEFSNDNDAEEAKIVMEGIQDALTNAHLAQEELAHPLNSDFSYVEGTGDDELEKELDKLVVDDGNNDDPDMSSLETREFEVQMKSLPDVTQMRKVVDKSGKTYESMGAAYSAKNDATKNSNSAFDARTAKKEMTKQQQYKGLEKDADEFSLLKEEMEAEAAQ